MTSDGQSASNSERLSFEDALTQLQDVVLDLESGTLSLDESLNRYQMGAELVERCQRLIAQAELRIVELTPDAHGTARP